MGVTTAEFKFIVKNIYYINEKYILGFNFKDSKIKFELLANERNMLSYANQI